MFDFGFSELLLVAVVALLVLGPERLPRAAKMGGLWVRRARASWYSVKAQFERELADEELRRSLQETRDEIDGLRQELKKPIEEPTPMQSAPRAVAPPADPQGVPAATPRSDAPGSDGAGDDASGPRGPAA